MRQLVEAGVEVVPLIRSSDEIASMSMASKAVLPVSPIYAPAAQRELTTLISRHRPDVLHLHNPYPLLSPYVIKTAHKHGVPVVQTVHNYRHVCVAGVMFRDGKPCHDCVGRKVGLPAVQHACYRGSRLQSAAMATALAVHRSTWREVDRFLVLTPILAGFLESTGIPKDRIVVKPNAIPDPGRHDQTGDGFLFAGRLSEEKGIELLLEAWCRRPDGELGRLTIAGDGPLRPQVQAVAAQRSDVSFVGLLSPAELRQTMRDAAAVVIPSTCDDVSPVVTLEALGNARPVLGTARGGLPWQIGRGESDPAGWVVAPTAEALSAGLAQAKIEAHKLTDTARARYESMFAPSVVMATLLDTYRGVSDRSARRGPPAHH